MLRTIETLRLYALLFSVPLGLVWAMALPIWHGVPLVAGFALLSLYYATLAADRDVRAGRNPRLGLSVDREELDRDTLEAAPLVFGLGTLVMGVALLVAAPLYGLILLALLGAAAWRAGLPARDKHFLIEYAAPGALVIIPATLLRAGGSLSEAAYAGAWLTALTLALAIMLCLVRDRAADDAAGARTTAARLGPIGSTALATVWTVALPTLSMLGTAWGWWGWSPTVLFVWAAFGALPCLWVGRPGWAAGLVTLVGGLACALVAATLG